MADTKFEGSVEATAGFEGELRGGVVAPMQVLADDGAITIKAGVVVITKATAAAITLAAPVAADNGKRLEIISTTAAAHTVTVTGGIAGGGAAADVGTFGAAAGNRVGLIAYAGAWYLSGANVNVTFA